MNFIYFILDVRQAAFGTAIAADANVLRRIRRLHVETWERGTRLFGITPPPELNLFAQWPIEDSGRNRYRSIRGTPISYSPR